MLALSQKESPVSTASNEVKIVGWVKSDGTIVPANEDTPLPVEATIDPTGLATSEKQDALKEKIDAALYELDGVFVQLPDNATYTPPSDCRDFAYMLVSGTFTLNGVTLDISATGKMVIPWGGGHSRLYVPGIVVGAGAIGFAVYTVPD